MKVLQINVVCGIGSTGRIATDLYQAMRKRGYDSYIAYGRGVAKKCEMAIKIGTDSDIYAHVARTRVFDRHGFGSKKATEAFVREVELLNPDVIHLHNIHGYYINVKVLFDYLRKSGKPVVWTLHDCWSFTGHCAHFEYAGCDKWKTRCFACPEKSAYPQSLLLDNSRKNYQDKKELFTGIDGLIIVTPSQWLANLVKQSYLKEYPIHVIHNGIDISTFRPRKNEFRKRHNLTNEFVILGVTGIWSHKKGWNFFLELSRQLRQDEKIVLVGVTDKQKRQLPKNIIGITKTDNVEELAEIYSASDIYLNPTLEDNYPTTNIEALACGTPVITFATGGSPESIDEKRGVTAKSKDVAGIIDAIKEIREAYASGNYDDLGKDVAAFSVDLMCQKYFELSKTILQTCEGLSKC